MTPDFINGLFEAFGFIFVTLNIRVLFHAKKLVGFSWLVQAFFTSWGFWNMFYYPHLHQIFSAIAAALLSMANLAYTTLAIKYRRAK